MSPQKIRVPGLTLAIMLWTVALIPYSSFGQACSGTLQTITYDTVIYGGGTQDYSLPLRQFSLPDGSTFLSANIEVYLTTTASAQFQNTNSTIQTFNPNISRGDEVDLGGDYLTNGAALYNFPHTSIAAGDTKVYPTKTVFNNYKIIDYLIDNSDPTLNSFQGSGNLDLSYVSATYINNVPLGVIPSSTASDNIVFSITYTYCAPQLLTSNFLSFLARRQDAESVMLNWSIANETRGRRYDIEVSTDGNRFSFYGSVSSNPAASGDTQYGNAYDIAPGTHGKLYFRLKQVATDGSSVYSPVRTVDLDADGGARTFLIYPNPPTDFINVVFPPTGGGGWQVDILAADGARVQRDVFFNAATARVNFHRKLAAGTYFLRATDVKTSQSQTKSFIVR
jgi:hypothetical protein